MRRGPNPLVGVNYLAIDSRMAEPPAYWLQRLFDYDNMLVVFPSIRTPFAYVLARRRQFTRGLDPKVLIDTIDQPDTKFCLAHGLVPVSMIYRHGDGWSIDNIIASLQRRDVWRAGGAEQATKIVEAAEDAAETKRKTDLRTEMWNRSGQAWESYKRRTGQRVSVPGRASAHPAPTNRASGSTSAAGLILP